ncbi:PREDICTED: coiled-coil domain-containing protein 51-like [Priapulus caudatus]|uniref:Coiled-coil domain-containing protein 51-like n=1 Tax=Priapulus caudatus TaxID=37621 RepID=A0ABM1EZ51_PRICU|nr:PREDICTED: coiled-coil domain-containing protein 51-like [Priapulus caudatus]
MRRSRKVASSMSAYTMVGRFSRPVGNLAHFRRHFADNAATTSSKSPVAARVGRWMQMYEDFIGITEVKEAQNGVLLAEQRFRVAQDGRRETQAEIQLVQMRLKDMHGELDKVSRGEDRYLRLVTRETRRHQIGATLLAGVRLRARQRSADRFAALATAVRESHEREREYAEKTKYWSLIGSVWARPIASRATTVAQHVRLRELGDIAAATDAGRTESLVGDGATHAEMERVRALVAAATACEDAGFVVAYAEPRLREVVAEGADDLEWRVKVNSIGTVVFVYAAFALTLPVLYNIFKGL